MAAALAVPFDAPVESMHQCALVPSATLNGTDIAKAVADAKQETVGVPG